MRTLNTPITEVVAEKQLLRQGQYHVALNEDGTIDLDNSYYMIWVMNFPSEEMRSKKVLFPALPANIKTTLVTLHNQSKAAAEAIGLMGSGTDVADF